MTSIHDIAMLVEQQGRQIEKLAQHNRQMKRALIALSMLAGMAVLMGQASPKNQTVEAGRFVLRDKAGKARLDLRVKSDGTPALVFRDQDERDQIAFYPEPDGTIGLFFADKHKTRRLGMFMSADGTTHLEFYNKDGQVLSRIPQL
jgi:hypothetical protein